MREKAIGIGNNAATGSRDARSDPVKINWR